MTPTHILIPIKDIKKIIDKYERDGKSADDFAIKTEIYAYQAGLKSILKMGKQISLKDLKNEK